MGGEYGSGYYGSGGHVISAYGPARPHPGDDAGEFDADYRASREEQIRRFDDDYRSWRRERQQKFASEFDSWRQIRVAAEGSEKGAVPRTPRK
jgi:hypothetical protein